MNEKLRTLLRTLPFTQLAWDGTTLHLYEDNTLAQPAVPSTQTLHAWPPKNAPQPFQPAEYSMTFWSPPSKEAIRRVLEIAREKKGARRELNAAGQPLRAPNVFFIWLPYFLATSANWKRTTTQELMKPPPMRLASQTLTLVKDAMDDQVKQMFLAIAAEENTAFKRRYPGLTYRPETAAEKAARRAAEKAAREAKKAWDQATMELEVRLEKEQIEEQCPERSMGRSIDQTTVVQDVMPAAPVTSAPDVPFSFEQHDMANFSYLESPPAVSMPMIQAAQHLVSLGPNAFSPFGPQFQIPPPAFYPPGPGFQGPFPGPNLTCHDWQNAIAYTPPSYPPVLSSTYNNWQQAQASAPMFAPSAASGQALPLLAPVREVHPVPRRAQHIMCSSPFIGGISPALTQDTFSPGSIVDAVATPSPAKFARMTYNVEAGPSNLPSASDVHSSGLPSFYATPDQPSSTVSEELDVILASLRALDNDAFTCVGQKRPASSQGVRSRVGGAPSLDHAAIFQQQRELHEAQGAGPAPAPVHVDFINGDSDELSRLFMDAGASFEPLSEKEMNQMLAESLEAQAYFFPSSFGQ